MLFAIVFLPFLVFLQLGLSYYASVATLATLMLLVYHRHAIIGSLIGHVWGRRTAAGCMMFVTTLVYDHVNSEDLLRITREITLFFLITGSAPLILHGVNERQLERFLDALIVVFSAILVLVAFQADYAMRGNYIGVPFDLFVQNSNTLPDELALRFTQVRPMGTYGEPSYLGVVCISLLLATHSWLWRSYRVKILYALLLTCIVVSKTFSGVISAAMIFAFASLDCRKLTPINVALIVVAVIASVVLFSVDNPFSERLDKIMGGGDDSSSARVLDPLLLVPDVLVDDPTGIPIKQLIGLGFDRIVHNALINLIFNFGWFGFFVMFALVSSFRTSATRLYIVIVAIQNGGLFTPDKFVLICFTMMLFNCFNMVAAQARANGTSSTLGPPVAPPGGAVPVSRTRYRVRRPFAGASVPTLDRNQEAA